MKLMMNDFERLREGKRARGGLEMQIWELASNFLDVRVVCGQLQVVRMQLEVVTPSPPF